MARDAKEHRALRPCRAVRYAAPTDADQQGGEERGRTLRGQSPATKKTQSPFSVIPTRCPV